MLPAAARLRTPAQFAAVTRRGRRGSSDRVIAHVLRGAQVDGARAGLIVSKKVGNSVIRHQVSRRLRAILRERLIELPAGTDVVVRALPLAKGASSAELRADMDTAIRRALEGRRR